MNREPLLKTKLDRFIRGAGTSVQSLRDAFMVEGDPKRAPLHASYISLPIEVYDAYWDLHEKSLKLAEAMEAVLNDPEHDLIMSEARDQGYRLPNIAAFRHEIADYKAALEEFDCYAVRSEDDGYVRIPIETARYMQNLIAYNCFMVARVFDGVFKTDYMKHFTDLRQKGFAYAGTTALQETLNVLVGMCRTARETERQIDTGRQKSNWPHLVV
jgi:hypothetical protein